MKTGEISLKEYYPFLGREDADPKLLYYISERRHEEQGKPSVLICPGGGYWICSNSENICMNIIEQGFNAFCLIYSTNSTAPRHYPTQVLEVAAAMEFIKRNATEWNCDTEKIGIMGNSAGGHLAAHYSNIWDSPVIREHFPNSVKPFATALCYPVISAEPPIGVSGSLKNLLGHELTETEIHDFSLENLVNKNTPTTFIWHTSDDTTAPALGSLLYAAALAKNKVPYEMHIYPTGDHGLSLADERMRDARLKAMEDKDGLAKENLVRDMAHIHNWVEAFNKWLIYTFK